MRHADARARQTGGFTLLEMALTMLIVAILMTAIFAVVGGTTQLADSMERGQDRDGQRHAFSQFCERTFRALPGNGLVRLRVKQSGNHYLSELALKNAPSVFSGVGGGAVTILSTEEQADGYVRVVLTSLTEEEATDADNGKLDPTKSPRIVLLENVAKCEWKIYEPRSQQWVTLWNEKAPLGIGLAVIREFTYPAEFDPPQIPKAAPAQGPSPATPVAPTPQPSGSLRPGLIELTLAVAGDAEQRFVFWMPPAQVPRQTGLQMATPTNSAVPANAPTPPATEAAPGVNAPRLSVPTPPITAPTK